MDKSCVLQWLQWCCICYNLIRQYVNSWTNEASISCFSLKTPTRNNNFCPCLVGSINNIDYCPTETPRGGARDQSGRGDSWRERLDCKVQCSGRVLALQNSRSKVARERVQCGSGVLECHISSRSYTGLIKTFENRTALEWARFHKNYFYIF